MTERQQDKSFATNTVKTSQAGDGGSRSRDESCKSNDFHGVLDTSVFTTSNMPDLSYSNMKVDSKRVSFPEQEPFFNGESVDKPREENKREH